MSLIALLGQAAAFYAIIDVAKAQDHQTFTRVDVNGKTYSYHYHATIMTAIAQSIFMILFFGKIVQIIKT